MLCGERCVPMPTSDPHAFLLASGHASFMARLSDELLMDYLRGAMRSVDRTNRMDCYVLDAIRAEFAHRHAPAVEGVCPNCEGPDGYPSKHAVGCPLGEWSP